MGESSSKLKCTTYLYSVVHYMPLRLSVLRGGYAGRTCVAWTWNGTSARSRQAHAASPSNIAFMPCIPNARDVLQTLAIECGCGDLSDISNPVVVGMTAADYSVCASATACGGSL